MKNTLFLLALVTFALPSASFAGDTCRVLIMNGDLSGTNVKMRNLVEAALEEKAYKLVYNNEDFDLKVTIDTMSKWSVQECDLSGVLARVTVFNKNGKRLYIKQRSGCTGEFFGRLRRTIMLKKILKKFPLPPALCAQAFEEPEQE